MFLSRLRGAINNVVGNLDGNPASGSSSSGDSRAAGQNVEKGPPVKFRYTRPHFLQLNTDDEVLVSADHVIRPIIVPRDMSKLPWNSGYAETINAGKSIRNEDHASFFRGLLRSVITSDDIASKVTDMMPTVPGHPRQIPIHYRSPDTILNGHQEASHSQESKESTTGKVETPKSEMNGTIDETDLKKDETQCNSCINDEIIPKTSPGDLLSPTSPIPLEEMIPPETPTESSEPIFKTAPSSPILKKKSSIVEESLEWIYFGIFDGHAGSGVSVAASNQLHRVINEKLQSIADLLIEFGLRETPMEISDNEHEKDSGSAIDPVPNSLNRKTVNGSLIINHDNHLPRDNIALLFHPASDKIVTVDSLIVGALESAFWNMDSIIAKDKYSYRMSGGCTVLVALFILGKLYIANAGDSRGVIYKDLEVVEASFDFTPESERERIKHLGLLRPEFLGNDFTHLEFVRRPARRDLGKRLLYRDAYMTGWAYKTVTVEDLKFPLIYGEGKRSRVLATIGVTRGFGDHELKAQNSDVDIKPFLTCQPEVRVFDLENEGDLTDSDVLIMGTDGLWDITSNEKAVEVVQRSLDHFPANDVQRFKYRYISAAQDLVMHSRGKSREKGRGWKTSDNKTATIDDISVFVIPLKPYRDEYCKWKEARKYVKHVENMN